MMILAIAWNKLIPHLNVVNMINARSQGRLLPNVIGCPLWFIASLMKYLKGASITRDEVSKFVSFLERYDGNGEYVQGGVSKFINTAATKTITMKLRKTQVGQDLLRHSNWIPQDSWRDMRSVHDIIAGLKEAYIRPSAQLFAEIDDIWDKRLDDFEKSATVDPLHLTESVVEVKLIHQMLEFTTTHAPHSKEMEIRYLERSRAF